MTRLVVEDGHFQYSPDRKVLDGISFSVSSGELIAVLGPNGVGKTTLLKCTMGLQKWSFGRSTLDGKDISTMSPRELFSAVSYVPQAKAGVPNYSIEDMVLLGRGSRIGTFSQPRKEDFIKVDECLERLGISFLKGKRCAEISGGELQMVLIARALASDPAVIVLDEPESNLDFRNQIMVMETLASLAREGVACLFNTHYPAHALQYANKSLLLERNGRATFGSTDDIINEMNVERAFSVKAVIGSVETTEKVVRDVIPISLSDGMDTREKEENETLAAVTIIMDDPDGAKERFEEVLNTFRTHFVGRMGIPYEKRGVNVVIITIDAKVSTIEAFVSALNRIGGVVAKATLAPVDKANKEV